MKRIILAGFVLSGFAINTVIADEQGGSVAQETTAAQEADVIQDENAVQNDTTAQEESAERIENAVEEASAAPQDDTELEESSGPASATVETKKRFISRVELRVSGWKSKGSNVEQTFAEDAIRTDTGVNLAGSPLSRLSYDDLDSDVFEIGLNVGLPKGFYLDVSYGKGSVSGGQLVDEDFGNATFRELLEGPSANRSDIVLSSTTSSIDDEEAKFINAELGKTVFTSKNNKWSFDAFAKYQSIEETHVATGVFQNACALPFFFCLPAGTDVTTVAGLGDRSVITNKLEWDSWILGVTGRLALTDKFTLKAKFGYVVDSDVESRDTHHLRDDLAKNPSFLIETSGGGYDAELEFGYAINNNWEILLAYQKIKRDFDRKDDIQTVFPSDPADGVEKSGAAIDYERDGFKVTVKFSFGAGRQ